MCRCTRKNYRNIVFWGLSAFSFRHSGYAISLDVTIPECRNLSVDERMLRRRVFSDRDWYIVRRSLTWNDKVERDKYSFSTVPKIIFYVVTRCRVPVPTGPPQLDYVWLEGQQQRERIVRNFHSAKRETGDLLGQPELMVANLYRAMKFHLRRNVLATT